MFRVDFLCGEKISKKSSKIWISTKVIIYVISNCNVLQYINVRTDAKTTSVNVTSAEQYVFISL